MGADERLLEQMRRQPRRRSMVRGGRRAAELHPEHDVDHEAPEERARELEEHPHAPAGPGGGRFVPREEHQRIAQRAYDDALKAGHPPETARAVRRGVLRKLSGEPEDAPALPRADEEGVRHRWVEPDPREDEDENEGVTLVADKRHPDLRHVYHRGEHIGRVVYAPNMPVLGRAGGSRAIRDNEGNITRDSSGRARYETNPSEYDMPGSWRAEVPGYEELPHGPFHSPEYPHWDLQYGFARDPATGETRKVWVTPDTWDPELGARVTRWRTIGFGDTPDEAAAHFSPIANQLAASRTEGYEPEPVTQVIPHGPEYDPQWREVENEVVHYLRQGLNVSQIAHRMDMTSPRDFEAVIALARDLRARGRWVPENEPERREARRRAEEAFERARAKGMTRSRAAKIADAVYRKLAPPDQLEIPRALTPRKRPRRTRPARNPPLRPILDDHGHPTGVYTYEAALQEALSIFMEVNEDAIRAQGRIPRPSATTAEWAHTRAHLATAARIIERYPRESRAAHALRLREEHLDIPSDRHAHRVMSFAHQVVRAVRSEQARQRAQARKRFLDALERREREQGLRGTSVAGSAPQIAPGKSLLDSELGRRAARQRSRAYEAALLEAMRRRGHYDYGAPPRRRPHAVVHEFTPGRPFRVGDRLFWVRKVEGHRVHAIDSTDGSRRVFDARALRHRW